MVETQSRHWDKAEALGDLYRLRDNNLLITAIAQSLADAEAEGERRAQEAFHQSLVEAFRDSGMDDQLEIANPDARKGLKEVEPFQTEK